MDAIARTIQDRKRGRRMSKWIAEFDLEDGDTMPEHMDLEYKGAKIDFHCKPLEQELCEDTKWIPCSVKMPKPDEFIENVRKYYLVQNEYGDMCVASYTNRGWLSINALYILEDIVAWRQLPERYKAEAEESNSKYVVEVCNKFHNYRDQIGIFPTYDEAKVFADKKDFDFDESSEYVEITEVEGGNV